MRFAATWVGVALAVSATLPAAAIDLTGTWVSSHTFRCTRLMPGSEPVTEGPFDSSDLAIVQTKDDLVVDLVEDGDVLQGRVFSDGKKDVGRGLAQACVSSQPGVLLTHQILDAKTFEPNGDGVSGRLTISLIRSTPYGHVTCKKVQFERVSSARPTAQSCP